MRVGSLFSGIGGFDLGFERAGMSVTWQCEIEPFPRAVLRKHWPHATLYEDVRSIRGHAVEPVDVICGGFPCQDISLAGRGAGIDGERSGLWSEYARIVRECRPRWVVAENVPALRTRGYDRVHDDLEAAGYTVEAFVVSAADVGAPHLRKRVWIVAHASGERLREQSGRRSGPDGEGAALAELVGTHGLAAHADALGCEQQRRCGVLDGERPAFGDDTHGRGGARDAANADTERWQAARDAGKHGAPHRDREAGIAGRFGGGGDAADAHRDAVEGLVAGPQPGADERQARLHGGARSTWDWGRAPEPSIRRVDDGLPRRVDRTRRPRLAALGNALLPQIAEAIGRAIMKIERMRATR